METTEKRFIPCPECGDERGKSRYCELCKQYNSSLRTQVEKQRPKSGPGSQSWEDLKSTLNKK